MKFSGVAAEVCCISTDTIRPATYTDTTTRLELTPWDLNLLTINVNQKGLLFHKPKEDHRNLLTHLKTSLSHTLDHFYPLAGRLATQTYQEENTISVYVHCNNAGAEFVHATADVTISDVLHPLSVPRFVHDFFRFNGSINYDGVSQPLLAIQVTELIDGIFIGCTMNHVVADGGSFWRFMNSWSEISRTKCAKISCTPYLNRWFPKGTALPIPFPSSAIENSIKPYSLPPLMERFFHFAPQNIAKLKAKANLENNTNNVISSLQAVLAHVWLSVMRVKQYDMHGQVRYRLLMNNRTRLNPPLPEEYFGNSVTSGFATTDASDLMTRGLGFAAALLNQVVSSHTHEKICSDWKIWVEAPVFICIDKLEINTLVTGSSPRFNMYGNDFGWGGPIAVRSGSANKFDGKIAVYPGAVKGSIEIEACLSPKTLMNLGEDSEFMERVGHIENENMYKA